MTPTFSIDPRYVLWLWRYQLMSVCAIAVLLAVAICWTVRRHSILEVRADDHGPPNIQLAPHDSTATHNPYNRGEANL
jgi:hypothetical protein